MGASDRALECRATLCALEVEAPFEFLLGEVEKNPALRGQIVFDDGAVGLEKDSSADQTIVTFLSFRRKGF
jgi:hypothetical protein